jgi:glycosyltransferase involved in cell wall biosynthesis
MLRAFEDPRATQARADHARQRAADMFSRERMLAQYANCYEKLTSIPPR